MDALDAEADDVKADQIGDDELEDLGDLLSKKKKKKKKAFNLDDLETALPELDATKEASADTDQAGDADATADADLTLGDGDLDFNLPLKKKKKKKVTLVEPEPLDDLLGLTNNNNNNDLGPLEETDKENVGTLDAGVSTTTGQPTFSWANSDRDYTYDELLDLVFSIIKEKNPDIVAGEKRRLVMRPPQVLRVGTKKSSFANFIDICKSLHRQPNHMQAFLLAELGTSGSVDANSQLIIKGKFQQKQIESVLRKYIKEYVACQTCRSPETILQKDTRLFFLQCETCGSRRSVASIKSGFQAVTGKRAAIRAKTA